MNSTRRMAQNFGRGTDGVKRAPRGGAGAYRDSARQSLHDALMRSDASHAAALAESERRLVHLLAEREHEVRRHIQQLERWAKEPRDVSGLDPATRLEVVASSILDLRWMSRWLTQQARQAMSRAHRATLLAERCQASSGW